MLCMDPLVMVTVSPRSTTFLLSGALLFHAVRERGGCAENTNHDDEDVLYTESS